MVQDIQQQIKHGEIAPVYVFCGKETYLLESALQQLVDAIAPGGENAFNLERVNGAETNLREIVNLANMLPFFAQRKLLIVEDAPWFGSGKQESSQQETEKTQGGKKITGGGAGRVFRLFGAAFSFHLFGVFGRGKNQPGEKDHQGGIKIWHCGRFPAPERQRCSPLVG